MTTKLLEPTAANILRCSARLKAGGLVAFPTETVYALGAVATDPAAIEHLYEAKGRPPQKPLIVAVAKKSDIPSVVKSVPAKAQTLIDSFMPGPLTLVMEKADVIPDIVTAGGESVAVRIPDDPIAQKLISLVGKPVVVPSANSSDKAASTQAAHVLDDLSGKIDYVLDGGRSRIGIESTIVDMRTQPPTVLREGGVPVCDIEALIGEVNYAHTPDGKSSYTPKAEVLFSAYYDDMAANIRSRAAHLTARGKKIAVLCLDENKNKYGKIKTYGMGSDYAQYARGLFAALRQAEADGFDTIIAEGVKPEGIGNSLIIRLIKLSGGLII